MDNNFIKIPKHLGIILDGNGRWAKKRNLKRTEGHKIGAEKVIDITRASNDLGIGYLSIFAFSTENWKRPKTEVSSIMELLNLFINNHIKELDDNNVKLRTMGDLSKLSYINRKAVEYAVNRTKDNTGLVLNIGLNYGGRQEIVRAVKNIVMNKEIKIEDIDESLIYNNLYTYDFPELDLLIRTGGEKRISNFMIYQLAYSELYFTDVLWPDFDKDELFKAIEDYNKRDRRFGGLNE